MAIVKVEKSEVQKLTSRPFAVIETDGSVVLNAFGSIDLNVIVVDHNTRSIFGSLDREIHLGESRAYLWGKNVSAIDITDEQQSLVEKLFKFIVSRKSRFHRVFKTSELPRDYPGDYNNDDRAGWALEAIMSSIYSRSACAGDYEEAISDLLVDLMHLCDRKKLNFDELLQQAQWHHIEEVKEEKTIKRKAKRATRKRDKKN